MFRANPGKDNESAKKNEIGQAPVHQTVGNAEKPEGRERGMASNTGDPIRFRGATSRQHRAWWSSDQPTHEKDEGQSHQRNVQVTNNEVEKITAESSPQLDTSMFMVCVRACQEKESH